MATHCSQAMQAVSSKVGSPRMSSPSILMAPLGQMEVQGLQGISWEQWKMGNTPSSSSGISSVMTAPGRALRISAVCSHSSGHFAHVPAQHPGDLGAADLAREHGRAGLGDLLRVARRQHRQAELLGLLEELVHGIQAHGHQQGVALEGLLGAGNDLPGRVELGDGDALHLLLAVGADDGVAGVDGHAHAHQLVLVDLVAAALVQGLAEAHHLDARLQRVVAADEARRCRRR